ncbi:hypothetical protein E4U55_005976 [Claviceps digitariae]|nr:hypothetical protein E4U55_005976 [Claviceps digitariae]
MRPGVITFRGTQRHNFPLAMPSASLSGRSRNRHSHELVTFNQIHFSNDAVAKFATEFTNLPLTNETACVDESYAWEDEDDLGFYHDGVKRTLTDEQIAIFRHSEMRELEKRRNKAKAAGLSAGAETTDAQRNGSTEESSHSARARSNRGIRKKKKKGGRNVVHEPKPDLRKRTWDVVDAGLDSLDYD